MKKKTGKVYLIGAGPGDPGLISVRGKELLQKCDVVIYDALVHPLLSASLPDRIRRIYVGKRGGECSTLQSRINRLLSRETAKGNLVARLKGGDPLVLGRGSEEMDFLQSQGIPYDVIPGISSALGAPSWAGIPVTHRSLARSVAIVTGHLKAGESIQNLELPVADTLVFLMAMQNIEQIAGMLLAAGRFSRRTPAVIIRNGTLPDQQVVRGTLGTIVSLKKRYAITSPALLIVGKTAAFAGRTHYRRRPLAGTRVVVLRTPEQSEALLQALYTQGATVIPWPIIRIKPRSRLLDRINASFLKPYTMIIFTSPNGVRIFMDALLRRHIDARSLWGKKLAVLGAGTAQVLAAYGIIPDIVPRKYVAEAVLSALPAAMNREKVLIPRASKAREILPKSLRERGAAVTVLPVYDTVKGSAGPCPVKDGDYVLFTSSSTAEFFFNHHSCKTKAIVPCCMGAVTAATVRRYYKGPVRVARNATIAALVSALVKAVRQAHVRHGATP